MAALPCSRSPQSIDYNRYFDARTAGDGRTQAQYYDFSLKSARLAQVRCGQQSLRDMDWLAMPCSAMQRRCWTWAQLWESPSAALLPPLPRL